MTTVTAQTLLIRDLEARSAGTSGRRLTEVLALYRVDQLGQASPVDFARRLWCLDQTARQALEELLEWTPWSDDLSMVALAALSPKLDEIALRLARGRAGDDTVSEVLCWAVQALRWTGDLVDGERASYVLREALRRSRAARRSQSRYSASTRPWPEGLDIADEGGFVEAGPRWPEDAVEVVSARECELIEVSRAGCLTLTELARRQGVPYDALRMRRSRAEARIRARGIGR